MHIPFSISWPCLDEALNVGIGAVLMISGNEFALKYCFPGCSFVLCSREYCSRLFSLYFFWPYISGTESKNWFVCLPISSMYGGGNLRTDVNESFGVFKSKPPPRWQAKTTHPSISTIRVIWLYSLVPGNSGSPKKSSTAMQPRDHISMAAVYGIPKRTSGDR